eukprot:12204942-Alexandrium_andersonii.AAC.1
MCIRDSSSSPGGLPPLGPPKKAPPARARGTIWGGPRAGSPRVRRRRRGALGPILHAWVRG